MLKNKKIEISIGSSNFKHYFEKYGPYNKGDKIEIEIEDLPRNSRVRVIAICKICNSEIEVFYQNYIIQYKRENFYCCKDCKMIKTKETNRKLYGMDWGLSSEIIKEKTKKTLLEKYNITNISQRSDIRKIRSERLKDEEYQNKMLQGVISKYGTNNVSKIDYIQKQKEETLMSNYGVTNPSQSTFLFEKSQKSGKRIKYHENTNLYYRGTYELHFLNYCFEKGINVIKGPSIIFNFKDKKKVYHSDYFLPEYNLICEIKSNYYYNKYIELNLIKEKETIKQGYNFIFIIDKNYETLK